MWGLDILTLAEIGAACFLLILDIAVIIRMKMQNNEIKKTIDILYEHFGRLEGWRREVGDRMIGSHEQRIEMIGGSLDELNWRVRYLENVGYESDDKRDDGK